MTTPLKGRPLLLETRRFALRSLKPSDASLRWLNWHTDPEVMNPLNMPIQKPSVDAVMKFIASADNIGLYLIGIFDLESKVLIGYFKIMCDRFHRRAGFNVLIGDKSWWGKGVINETRAALLDEFFNNRGIEKVEGAPLTRNFPAVFNYKAQGWRHEGTLRGHLLSTAGGSRLDQYLFGLTKDEWRKLRGGHAE